jgi:hypothetical protein
MPYNIVMLRASVLVALLSALAGSADAADGAPAFVDGFAKACPVSEGREAPDWRVSAALAKADRAARVRCLPDGSGSASTLRVEVKPGDAYNPDPTGDYPTERVELQVRREVVRFDEPVWYRFRFRLEPPWPVVVNRTVIHQIKQNIDQAWEQDSGGPCPSANPLFKIEAGGDGREPQFVVKTRGTQNCLDGKVTDIVCGPWRLEPERWYRVNVMMRASQDAGRTRLAVWLDGRPCPAFTGILGYLDHGKRDKAGKPVIDTQPRFGVYRDARVADPQAIDFADIAFWSSEPGDPEWAALKPAD